MPTGYVTDARYALHDMPDHPENARRLAAVQTGLSESGLLDRLTSLSPVPVPTDLLLTVHTTSYLDRLERTAQGQGTMFGLDTYIGPQSYDIARLAAGGAVAAVGAVLDGRVTNALAAVRPPGHHATPDEGMGFCLMNNVALAARYALREHDLARVMVVDYDVHHGNGTQDIFYADADVLYVSTHQSPLYPGTGALAETGRGAGEGATVNLPLSPGVGDQGYAAVFEQLVWPLAQRFEPNLILVSAGFDAHWGDPLAQMQLTLSGYARLTRALIDMAETLCGGRIVFILEGGYNLTVLKHAWADVAHALLGEAPARDALGPARHDEPPVDSTIRRVRQLHRLD